MSTQDLIQEDTKYQLIDRIHDIHALPNEIDNVMLLGVLLEDLQSCMANDAFQEFKKSLPMKYPNFYTPNL